MAHGWFAVFRVIVVSKVGMTYSLIRLRAISSCRLALVLVSQRDGFGLICRSLQVERRLVIFHLLVIQFCSENGEIIFIVNRRRSRLPPSGIKRVQQTWVAPYLAGSRV